MNQLRNNSVNEGWRQTLLLVTITGMLIGLLFSRVILSASLIAFVGVAIFNRNILIQLRIFIASPFLWLMTLLFLMPLMSGFWSTNTNQWLQILRIKLPLLLMPVCFAQGAHLNYKNWQRIALVFLFLIFSGICWSLWMYVQNSNSVQADYLRAHTMQTPLGNDHVRFSLLVAVAVLTCVFVLFKGKGVYKKSFSALLWAAALAFVLYLHILAVRTGLFCFYIGFTMLMGWLIWHQKRPGRYLLLLILVISLPLAAYFALPTFRNRISYFKYDLSFVKKNVYQQGSNDGNRIASIRAGWQLLNQNPALGVGFGNITEEANKIYESKYPQMKEEDKILPSSEWMMYGAGNGWPGIILFSIVMIIPFGIKGLRRNLAWISVSLFIASSYLFDIGLEVQYGVFVHAFVLLWWYSWLQSEK